MQPKTLTVGSLFSGIGGFDLGLERAGFDIKWQVENDDYCRQVLRKHWPHVPCHYDIRSIDWHWIPRVDLVCGGFPCQPFSSAGRGRYTAPNLWREMYSACEILKPTWIIVENVAHAANMVLGQVATDLETIGYEIGTVEIPACAVGLDHWRPRYWICGYANLDRKSSVSVNEKVERMPEHRRFAKSVGTTNGVPNRVDRLRALGNAIVPQIAEALGRMILEVHQ